ncbi:Uncharacterized protein APZ42_002643 [Daphnia magna]|uniref:Uncharacterized protein n=1 Tax=Daphnia magna TaxID=35525 RepID=A0A164I4W4_9CRUS|nr:Uncharacterized protein APZ42_002643 [Daphnia magna]
MTKNTTQTFWVLASCWDTNSSFLALLSTFLGGFLFSLASAILIKIATQNNTKQISKLL